MEPSPTASPCVFAGDTLFCSAKAGFIPGVNGGIYALQVAAFLNEGLPDKFSFEKDYLEKYFLYRRMIGSVQDEYFIDIGIPEDFQRAQTELMQAELDLQKINSEWTLFLDRDGVINYEKKGDYIRNWREFKFYEGAVDAINIFSKKFLIM
jgi:D-glycero-alpha-D-manno-heptose 1-phosphate guanylyltransferase